MVARYNLVIYQGADFRRAFEIKDEGGNLIDLTGYTFRGQARLSHASGDAAFDFEFALRDQGTDTGYVDLHLPAASTQGIATKETNYFYDIEMIDTSGDVRRILEGKIKLYPEVTR